MHQQRLVSVSYHPPSYVGESDGNGAGALWSVRDGITRSPFPLFPKSLSQEVCLAHSCSLQGGLGARKQRAEALTQACAVPVGPPPLSPVGGVTPLYSGQIPLLC